MVNWVAHIDSPALHDGGSLDELLHRDHFTAVRIQIHESSPELKIAVNIGEESLKGIIDHKIFMKLILHSLSLILSNSKCPKEDMLDAE